MRKRGFTLVEMLVVVGIIALLSAILLPALSSARERGRSAVCASNLHQLGLSISMYTQDSDGFYPRGGDAVDILTDAWKFSEGGQYQNDAAQLRPLTFVLKPYVQNKEIWHCPSDSGYMEDDPSHVLLDAHPTAYDAFGMSYSYRTALTLKRKINLIGYEPAAPFTEHGPSDICVLMDSSGSWHGGTEKAAKRYNVLMADGRVVNQNHAQFKAGWKLLLDPPTPIPTP